MKQISILVLSLMTTLIMSSRSFIPTSVADANSYSYLGGDIRSLNTGAGISNAYDRNRVTGLADSLNTATWGVASGNNLGMLTTLTESRNRGYGTSTANGNSIIDSAGLAYNSRNNGLAQSNASTIAGTNIIGANSKPSDVLARGYSNIRNRAISTSV